eukprot:CAMPEP_0204376946 /NCGR_PEP_ID=MMETSP0469-20131031/50523_1 /ASSEMBLY_ACC=CAM_ASM_000384 /TAXON_ID=2969 /ORGANISM="Oxyrrhis marina" /LENGTH=409 /DNA_ID=CAMNT_0051367923 /DNA_START=1 /DNA_END=1230 /DNA_ORIENTATION=+
MGEDVSSSQNVYRIKRVDFLGSRRAVLLQSKNGPCPLLAIANVLLLRNEIQLNPDLSTIAFQNLIQMVINHILDKDAPGESTRDQSAEIVAALRQNIHEVLDILPKLNEGLDVNVKFGGPDAFEYTKELAVFDLFDVPLLHGWVVDPQDRDVYPLIGHLSYNQLMELLIDFEEAQSKVLSGELILPDAGAENETEEQAKIRQGMLVKEWLDRTASQLSYDGLVQVQAVMRERQLCVFFRNNHFNALFKKDGDLFLLATDIAFDYPSPVVWEKFDEVDGNTSGYFNSGFAEVRDGGDPPARSDSAMARALQGEMHGATEDDDYRLAMQLQYGDAGPPAPKAPPTGRPDPTPAEAAAAAKVANPKPSSSKSAPKAAVAAAVTSTPAPKAAPKAPPAEDGSKKKSAKSCIVQ